jgi:hypothetical protein
MLAAAGAARKFRHQGSFGLCFDVGVQYVAAVGYFVSSDMGLFAALGSRQGSGAGVGPGGGWNWR